MQVLVLFFFRGVCIDAEDKGTPVFPSLPKGKKHELCCLSTSASAPLQYKCLGGEPNKDLSGKILKCKQDEDCNRVQGQTLADKSKWDYECVTKGGPGSKFCCPVAKCPDGLTYMKTEVECSTNVDCLQDEEDKTRNPDARAICSDYFELNQLKKKRCCPIGDLTTQMPYCTKRPCTKSSDCVESTSYCHPEKKSCCYIGITRLDGSSHENSTVCQGTCADKNIFGTKVPQYCVLTASQANTGLCILSPYTIIKDKERRVNPLYKTILIISIILTLVFAFLALIMYVNYRSRNFCDKYTPKKKNKKGKKGKHSDSTSTGGKSTTKDSSAMSGVSGTSTGGGTTGDGTTGDPTGTKTGG
ncbi:hypothetical protein DICVIV_10501 [Dictyocaulus viviparus]|uniref:Uncharacterized protein n=1 Tax=Dictyocaulus viviparus TaxID=29172 RepID=A0A0D8XFW0_DICVI|nr:hypothetical protein DICVIV_10501 [Dictyocaulus viviparus]